jgi:hypothetical protein
MIITTLTAYIITIINSFKGILGVKIRSLEMQIGTVSGDNLSKLAGSHPIRI